MAIEVRSYNSINDLIGSIDEEVSRSKSQLGEYLRRFDEIRFLAERSRRLRETLLKAVGSKERQALMDGVKIGEITVVLDVRPEHELTVLEEAVKSYQERILTLQKARESLKGFEMAREEADEVKGIVCTVLENNGIPQRILVKLSV
jgi:Mg/Co/Ni transporter MgtE